MMESDVGEWGHLGLMQSQSILNDTSTYAQTHVRGEDKIHPVVLRATVRSFVVHLGSCYRQ